MLAIYAARPNAHPGHLTRFEAFRKQHAKELAELEAVHRRAEAKLTSEVSGIPASLEPQP